MGLTFQYGEINNKNDGSMRGEWIKMGCFIFAGPEVPTNLTDENPRLWEVRSGDTNFMTTCSQIQVEAT